MMSYELKRKIDLAGDGSITVTVSSSSPIDEADYMVLRPDVAREMAQYLTSLANALRPLDTP